MLSALIVIDELWRCRMEGIDVEARHDHDRDRECEQQHRPTYACRCPPIVQPLQQSLFAEKTLAKYGSHDLAREWIALFQIISGNCGFDKTNRGPSIKTGMKMNIPDTVFLSPSGQPSVWYKTSASKYVKARPLSAVTARSIREAFLPASEFNRVCAIARIGYQVETLYRHEFLDLCEKMEHACIRLKQCHDDTDQEFDVDTAEIDDTVVTPSRDDALDMEADAALPFCVQKSMQRVLDCSFLCVWKYLSANTSPLDAAPATASSLRSKSSVDLFLIRTESAGISVDLLRLDLEETKDKWTRTLLADIGFDVDELVPLLFQMKLLTGEIVSRINRSSTTSRQAVSIACEYFVHTPVHTKMNEMLSPAVVFQGLAGIQWHGQEATWETLVAVDPMSTAIEKAYRSRNSKQRQAPRSPRSPKTPSGLDANLSLTLHYELNPRFPSLQSPRVAENQWKHKTALLPPHVSPRYVGAEMPKMYRDGQFQPLLTPPQSDAVNRLMIPLPNTQPSPLSPRHPLSKKHAHVERELWARQDVHNVPSVFIAAVTFRSPPKTKLSSPRSPRSPRSRYRSIIKKELK